MDDRAGRRDGSIAPGTTLRLPHEARGEALEDRVAEFGGDPRTVEDQGDVQQFLVQGVAVLEVAVVPELLAMIGEERDHGGAGQGGEEAPQGVVHVGERLGVAGDDPLPGELGRLLVRGDDAAEIGRAHL